MHARPGQPGQSGQSGRSGQPGQSGRSGILTVGLVQYAPRLRDPGANIAHLIDSLDEVHDAIVVLPEFFLGSYSQFGPWVQEEPRLDELLAELREFSGAHRLSLVGSLPIRTAGTAVNGAVVIHRGTVEFSSYAKQRRSGAERGQLSPGSGSEALWITQTCCIVRVCVDILDPAPNRQPVAAGARIILGPATVSVDYLRTAHSPPAVENQVVSIFCNRHGDESDGIEYLGKSAVFLPDGSELAAPRDQEQVLLVDVELAHVAGYPTTFGWP